jgi:hypothetical protein
MTGEIRCVERCYQSVGSKRNYLLLIVGIDNSFSKDNERIIEVLRRFATPAFHNLVETIDEVL